jgi:hypothetical protein
MMKKNYLIYLSILVTIIATSFDMIVRERDHPINLAALQQIGSQNMLKVSLSTRAMRVNHRKSRRVAVKRIQQGMPYSKARKILIQQGWQPNLPASNGDIPDMEDTQIKNAYALGYGEVKVCSGTGLGLCRFEFINYKKELLIVSTTALPEFQVFHWFIEKY